MNDSLQRIKFVSRRKRLTDGNLYYVVEYIDYSLAFGYFGVPGNSAEELHTELMNSVSGNVLSEPIRLQRVSMACIIGWRFFVRETNDVVYLKLLGDAVFQR